MVAFQVARNWCVKLTGAGCLLAALLGCSKHSGTEPQASVALTADSPASGLAAEPPLVISADAPGEFTVHAKVAIGVATLAQLEAQAADGSWTPYTDLDSGRGYRLVETCASSVPDCRSLSAGESLTLAPWSGATCSAQCQPACASETFHPGRHRLVAHECENPARRYESPPFEMVASVRSLARLRAAAGLESARIFRLDPLHPVDSAASHPPAYVASLRVLSETLRPLTPELVKDFANWLRREEAFIPYQLFKRCLQRRWVGLLLENRSPAAAQSTTEVAIDINCNSLMLVTTDGRGRGWTESQFEPSRSEVVAFLRRALPDDQELQGLH